MNRRHAARETSGESPITGLRSVSRSSAARVDPGSGTHISTPVLSTSPRFRMRPCGVVGVLLALVIASNGLVAFVVGTQHREIGHSVSTRRRVGEDRVARDVARGDSGGEWCGSWFRRRRLLESGARALPLRRRPDGPGYVRNGGSGDDCGGADRVRSAGAPGAQDRHRACNTDRVSVRAFCNRTVDWICCGPRRWRMWTLSLEPSVVAQGLVFAFAGIVAFAFRAMRYTLAEIASSPVQSAWLDLRTRFVPNDPATIRGYTHADALRRQRLTSASESRSPCRSAERAR